jgi:hypothetical protein
LLGMGTFYVFATRESRRGFSQSYLQNGASSILEEMGRQIRPASSLATGCQAGDPNSLGVTNSVGAYCFYKSGTQLLELRPGGATPANLLLGTLAPIEVTSFTPTLLNGTSRARISFQLRWTDPYRGADTFTMTFNTDISRRNN